jgi:hypothetical protein
VTSHRVAVGQVWRRKPPGKERIRIDRVWEMKHPDIPPGELTVRAQPLHGGVYIVASPAIIAERYELEES